MIIKTFGGCLSGIEAELITVEVQTQPGLPRFSIVGLGDSAVQESRERVLAALASLRGSMVVELPDQILVNLSPADIRKVGSSLDLAIAAGIAASMGLVDPTLVQNTLFVGELSLSGEVKAVRGAIAYAVLAKRKNFNRIVCPEKSIEEVQLIDGIDILGGESLIQLIPTLSEKNISTSKGKKYVERSLSLSNSFDTIVGQDHAKRAMMIAAAGGHHMLMVGPPGCGKTMVAQSMTTILPSLEESEMLELVSIHSVAGAQIDSILQGIPPFRAPHYNISQAGLIGGGSRIRPGEITLAHRGILFLDEFPEYTRTAIEALRLPMESGEVSISRVVGTHKFPARFQLVVAMNPCPCGLYGYSEKCKCSALEVDKYQKRISAAVMDRIDLHVGMEAVNASDLLNKPKSKPTEDLRGIILNARNESKRRYSSLCAEIGSEKLFSHLFLSEDAKNFLINSSGKFCLSARAINKVIKVAATISILNRHDYIDTEDIAESLSYRVRIGKKEENQSTSAFALS